MRMLFKYIEITFRYFDLLFRYLAVKSLKPILYTVVISVFATGVYGLGSLMVGDIFYGISLLILARILYLLTFWFESLIDLEVLSREYADLTRYNKFYRQDLRVEKLKKFDYLRDMDIDYFRPKFWFIDEETFLKDLKEYKKLVDHYRKEKHIHSIGAVYDFTYVVSWNQEGFQSRYATNLIEDEIKEYISQIEESIEWDEHYLSEDKRKTSLKKRISNQKKLIELINDDPRQFIIEYIYRYYYEKHRYHPKRLEALREVDRKINYKLDSKTSIEIMTRFIEPNMESFTYEYHLIFDD